MTDFRAVLGDAEEVKNPFAAKTGDIWIEGTTNIQFLQDNFGQYDTAQEMIDATTSEGLKLFFAELRNQGILN